MVLREPRAAGVNQDHGWRRIISPVAGSVKVFGKTKIPNLAVTHELLLCFVTSQASLTFHTVAFEFYQLCKFEPVCFSATVGFCDSNKVWVLYNP